MNKGANKLITEAYSLLPSAPKYQFTSKELNNMLRAVVRETLEISDMIDEGYRLCVRTRAEKLNAIYEHFKVENNEHKQI